MYCTPDETRKARKLHKCTYCAQPIQAGETYKRWMSINEDGISFANKMHHECLDYLQTEHGDGGEYTPYVNARPDSDIGRRMG